MRPQNSVSDVLRHVSFMQPPILQATTRPPLWYTLIIAKRPSFPDNGKVFSVVMPRQVRLAGGSIIIWPNFLDCLLIHASVILFVCYAYSWTHHFGNEWANFETTLQFAHVVHGASAWNDKFWCQQVKGRVTKGR